MIRERIEVQKALEKSQKETFLRVAEIAKNHGLCLAIRGFKTIRDEIATMAGFEKVVYRNNIFKCSQDHCVFKRASGFFFSASAVVILSFDGFDASTLELKDLSFLEVAEKVESVLLEWSDIAPGDIARRKFWKCAYCGAVNGKDLKCYNCGAPKK